MKHSDIRLALWFIFQPNKFLQESEKHMAWINSPEAISESQDEKTYSQSARAAKLIRAAYSKSFWLVVSAVLTGGIVGKFLVGLGMINSQATSEASQYVGIALLLWATFGQVGWGLQTMHGATYPERVNDFLCRTLYVLGSFLLALSAGAAFA
tara:strand:+ start:734 stop:1192 length:459 start_codon:yes stop_codon:yes gene_type:complete